MNSSEWDKMGKNIKTNSIYDEDGYDIFGWNAEEINKETHSKYDKNGFDMLGYNKYGYDQEGYNVQGYDKYGYNREGYDKYGKTKEEWEKAWQLANEEQKRKSYFGLLNNAKKLAKGELSIQEYIKKSTVSIDELISFANRIGMSADVVKGLHRQKALYKMYIKPFSKKKYLDSTIILVNEKPIKPTEQEVDKCIEFLKSKKEIISILKLQEDYKKGKVSERDV